jgi:dihydrolipoamide dehydrogenase
MSYDYDVAVIGGGPAGYVGAIRAAQLGKKTAIIDKRETLGGTCLNVGCIPSKALLDSTEHYDQARHSYAEHGIEIGELGVNLEQMMKRKDKVVSDVCSGVDFLISKNKIERYVGHGRLTSEHDIKISGQDEGKISAQDILLATGSEPMSLPGMEVDGKDVLFSDHALSLTEIPQHLLVIGAGVIGLELGSVWQRLGAKVTVVELLPALFPSWDKQMASTATRILKGQGFDFLFGHKVQGLKRQKGQVTVSVADKDGKEQKLTADKVLMAVGRKPYLEDLGLETVGISKNEQGRIDVDPTTYRTSVANIYAAGDVVNGPMLAHKASDEGIAWAERLAGQAGHVSYEAIPNIVYTWPEFAWVGQGEEALKEQGIAYKTGKFFVKANGRARAMNESEGLVKILSDKQTDRVLGVHIISPRASDLIIEAAMAVEFRASAEDLARTVHAHPTLSESVREAAMGAGGWSIHS